MQFTVPISMLTAHFASIWCWESGLICTLHSVYGVCTESPMPCGKSTACADARPELHISAESKKPDMILSECLLGAKSLPQLPQPAGNLTGSALGTAILRVPLSNAQSPGERPTSSPIESQHHPGGNHLEAMCCWHKVWLMPQQAAVEDDTEH